MLIWGVIWRDKGTSNNFTKVIQQVGWGHMVSIGWMVLLLIIQISCPEIVICPWVHSSVPRGAAASRSTKGFASRTLCNAKPTGAHVPALSLLSWPHIHRFIESQSCIKFALRGCWSWGCLTMAKRADCVYWKICLYLDHCSSNPCCAGVKCVCYQYVSLWSIE